MVSNRVKESLIQNPEDTIVKLHLQRIAKNAVDESTKIAGQPMRMAYTDRASNGNYYIAIVPNFAEQGKFTYEFNYDVWGPVTKELKSKVPSISRFLTYRQYKDKISLLDIEDMFEYYEDPVAEQMEGCKEDNANEVNDNDFILVPRRKPKLEPSSDDKCNEGFRCTKGRSCDKIHSHTYEEKMFFDVSSPKQRYNYKTVFCFHIPTCRYVHEPHKCCFAHKKEEYFCRPCGLTGDHLVVDCPHNDK
jgi:hypothetical protein